MDENITISYASSKLMEYTTLAYKAKKRVRPFLRSLAFLPALLFLAVCFDEIDKLFTDDGVMGALLIRLEFLYLSIGTFLVSFIRAYIFGSPNRYKITIDPISIICHKNGEKIGEYAFRDVEFVKMANMAIIHCIPDKIFLPVPLKNRGEIREFLNLLLKNIKNKQ